MRPKAAVHLGPLLDSSAPLKNELLMGFSLLQLSVRWHLLSYILFLLKSKCVFIIISNLRWMNAICFYRMKAGLNRGRNRRLVLLDGGI